MKLLLVMLMVLFVSCGGNTADVPALNGETCGMDMDCESGLCVTEFKNALPIPGGMCTDVCSFNDPPESQCPDGEICLRYVATQETFCYVTCTEPGGADECRVDEGWECACLDFLCGIKACIPPVNQAAAPAFTL